jgi:hypothetical protein
MLKKSLFVAVAVAMLAVSAQAGEIKVHHWPTTFVTQELATIPVVMDVGYWVAVKNQSWNKITLTQIDTNKFSGCTNITVEANFAVTLTCSIDKTGPVGGHYSCDFGPGVTSVDIDPGQTSVQVCAYLSNAELKNSNPESNVEVARVKIWVKPQA